MTTNTNTTRIDSHAHRLEASFGLLLTSLLMTFWQPPAFGQSATPRSTAELLPPETLVSVTTENLAEYLNGLRSQPLARILAEEEVAEFLEEPLASIMADLGAEQSQPGREGLMEIGSAVLSGAPDRFFAAITTHQPTENPSPKIGFLVGIEESATSTPHYRYPDRVTAERRAADRARALPITTAIEDVLSDLVRSDSLTVETKIAIDGGPYQRYTPTQSPEAETVFVVCHRGDIPGQGNWTIAASDSTTLDQFLSQLTDPTVPTLDDREAFRAVRTQLDMQAPASLHAYVNVQGILGMLEPWIVERDAITESEDQVFMPRDVWEILDLSALTSLGAAFETSEGLAHSRVLLHVDEETEGIFKVSPNLPLDREFLAIAPRDVIRCWSFHFDLKVISDINAAIAEIEHTGELGSVDEAVRKIEENLSVPLRESLLTNLGPRYLLLNDEGSLIPSYLLVAQSARPQAAQEAITGLIDFGIAQFDKEIPVSEIEYRGATITSMNLGVVMPNVASANGVVIVSSDIQATKRLIRHMEEAGPSILDRPELVAALAKLGPNITPVGVDFLDLKSTFEHWYGLISMGVGLAGGEDIEIPIDLDLLPIADTISQHLEPSIVISGMTADGTRYETFGPVAQEYTLGLITLVGTVGIYLGAKSVNQVFHESNRRLAEAQIRNFEGAIGQYRALHGGRVPESLEVLIQPDPQNFNESYLGDEIPTDPWGNPFQYTIIDMGYQITSFGADGLPGGDGENEDISTARGRNR